MWVKRLLPLVVPVFAGCATLRRPSVPDADLARRLVLALDGVDYRDIVAARGRGLFAGFRAPSRLISTFPSISDISWHEIFGVVPPRGYQRIFYSNRQNDVIGGALDAIRPIEFEDRMDMAFGTKFHHLSAYIASNAVARNEIDVATRDFFRIGGRSTVYVYNVGPDALQHTRGNLSEYLTHLDKKLTWLQGEYRRRTGRDLEIVVLSDHGHNRSVDAKFLPLLKVIEARGFKEVHQLRAPTDIAFSVDGVTTGFGLFAMPDSIPALAMLLASTEGIDVVTMRLDDSTFVVQAGTQRARIDRRGIVSDTRSAERYRYVPLDGDPLQYESILKQLRADGATDRDGFAPASTWVRYTASAAYPAAVLRIARGHTRVTLNPAPILVSVADAYRVGLGMVAFANRVRPLGGTHGALGATNALGVLMTTFVDTHDDATPFVRDQLGGFADLGPEKLKGSGARLASLWTIEGDVRSPFGRRTVVDVRDAASRAITPSPLVGSRPALEVWLTPKDLQTMGTNGALLVEIRRSRTETQESALIATSYLPLPRVIDTGLSTGAAPGWIASTNGLRFVLALQESLTLALAADTQYQVRIVRDGKTLRRGRTEVTSHEVATLTLTTNALGQLWPY